MQKRCALLAFILAVGSAMAQDSSQPQAPASAQPSHENEQVAEFRLEGKRFGESCGQLSFLGCAQLLFTDHPLHIAVGSIAPQNGIGAGLALVQHHDFSRSYLKWNFDAVGSSNGSWRAGGYMKIVPVTSRAVTTGKSKGGLVARPLFTVYAQSVSLHTVGFFGLGPFTTTAGKTFFGMRETIVGSHAIMPVPMSKKLNLSLIGEINGRFVDIRGDRGQPSPSIEQLYSSAAAPGLARQPAFIQFGEGLRIKPSFAGRLNLNYSAIFQQFAAPNDSTFSFRRFTVDLGHEIPLSHTRPISAKDGNSANECSTDLSKLNCPSIKAVPDRTGTLTLRFLLTESVASGGSVVPFYFQPTLGGSDINGNAGLSSYQDYRFRAPNLMLLHAGLEHSIWGPFGLALTGETGRVALARDDIGFRHLRHSFAGGITLRAGGMPMISLMYAWGGHEGSHTIANINTSLIGGSPRPSLY